MLLFKDFDTFVYDDHTNISIKDLNIYMKIQKEGIPVLHDKNYHGTIERVPTAAHRKMSQDLVSIIDAISMVNATVVAHPAATSRYVMASLNRRTVDIHGNISERRYVDLEALCEVSSVRYQGNLPMEVKFASKPKDFDMWRFNVPDYIGVDEVVLKTPMHYARMEHHEFARSHLVKSGRSA